MTGENPSEPPKPFLGPVAAVPLLLLAFAGLGAAMAFGFVMGIRALITFNLLGILVFLSVFAAAAMLARLAFVLYKPVRLATGTDLGGQVLLVVLAWAVMLGGAAAWRSSYVPPASKMVQEIWDEQAACRERGKVVVSVSSVTESHIPWSGFITVRATALARSPITLSGESWLESFSAEMEPVALEPGKPTGITMRIVNPIIEGVPRRVGDGPYRFGEIDAYFKDPAFNGGSSCKFTLIRDLITKPYKGSEFGNARIKLPGDRPVFRKLSTDAARPAYKDPDPMLAADSLLLISGWADEFREALPLAQAGDRDAQYNLGLMYGALSSGEGVGQALYWFGKAAAQGDVDSQYEVGVRYRDGIGAPKDPKAGLPWLRKAAAGGNGDAQYALGQAYALGLGVPEDREEAEAFFRKAAQYYAALGSR